MVRLFSPSYDIIVEFASLFEKYFIFKYIQSHTLPKEMMIQLCPRICSCKSSCWLNSLGRVMLMTKNNVMIALCRSVGCNLCTVQNATNSIDKWMQICGNCHRKNILTVATLFLSPIIFEMCKFIANYKGGDGGADDSNKSHPPSLKSVNSFSHIKYEEIILAGQCVKLLLHHS